MADAVYYTGSPNARRMTAADWERVGVKGQRTTVWNRGNEWSVPTGDLSAAALKYIEANAEDLSMVVMSENTRSAKAARPTAVEAIVRGYPDTPLPFVQRGVGAGTAGGDVAPIDEADPRESNGTTG